MDGCVFFFKQKTAYELRISDWSSDVCSSVLFAVGLSRHTRGIIRQNVFVSLGVVAFLVPATILGLGIGPAVAMHEGSTLLVVFNALRLLAYRDPAKQVA